MDLHSIIMVLILVLLMWLIAYEISNPLYKQIKISISKKNPRFFRMKRNGSKFQKKRKERRDEK
jgi:hypothetical protein